MNNLTSCDSILSLSSTLAWLYQYSIANAHELEFLFPRYTLPTMEETLHYNQLVLMNQRNTLSSSINKIIRQLVYFIINFLGKNRQIYQTVLPIIQEVINREIYYRNKGYVVFFHAQKSGFYILDQASYHSIKYPFTPACKRNFTRYPLAADRALHELRMDINSDQEPGPGSRLISVNYSIFGNFSLDDLGESTLSFFINNTNLFSKPAHFISSIDFHTSDMDEQNRRRDILKQMILDEQERRRKDRLPGRLLLIAIPCDKIDEFVYNSRQVGSLYHVDTPLVSEFLFQTYLSSSKQSFYTINTAQARILDLCFTSYGKNSGIIIESFDAIPEDEKILIEQQLASIFPPPSLPIF